MSDTRLYQLAELAALGLLNEAEQQELNAWLAAAPENRATYEEICGIVALGTMAFADVDPQTDAEWAKLSAAIAAPETPVIEIVRPPLTVRPPFWTTNRVWATAAAIALLAVVGYFAFFRAEQAPLAAQHYATALGETKEIQLADGSHVRLNGGSTLDALAGYGMTDRQLTLHGEAYFEVAKDKERPFIVSAGGTQAEALGTKFNVRVASTDASVQLSVTEGRVRFSNEKAGEMILTAGQVAVYDPKTGFVKEATVAQDAAGWIDNRLVFNDTPFPKAAEQIERTFGVTLHFPERLNAALLTANFDRKPLSDVLEVLTALYAVKSNQDGKAVTLSE